MTLSALPPLSQVSAGQLSLYKSEILGILSVKQSAYAAARVALREALFAEDEEAIFTIEDTLYRIRRDAAHLKADFLAVESEEARRAALAESGPSLT